MTGQITTLLNSGMDAFTNLWDVIISFPTAISGSQYFDGNAGNPSYSVRANGFNPPELTLTTGQADYKGVQITKLLPKIQGDRTFTLEFRMDSNYLLYYDLLRWKHIWMDPSGESNIQAGAMGDGATPVTADGYHYGQITVQSYTSQTPLSGYSDNSADPTGNAVGAMWTFFDVICTKVGSPAFQRASSDFVTVTSEFIFGRMVEPYSGGAVNVGLYPDSSTPPVLGV